MNKILIADDSAFMREVIKDIIRQSDWKDSELLEASNGIEAVELFRQEVPDLLLLDIMMPEKDGIAVLKEIGATAKAVVIVSSVEKADVIEEAKSLGAKAYITKPFDVTKVRDTLNSLFSA